MSEIKLTKNELRDQQKKLKQLEKYLPTLQLKKAMLQAEVNDVRTEIENFEAHFTTLRQKVDHFCLLLSTKLLFDPVELSKIQKVKKRYENIAGVDVPYFEEALFPELTYSLLDTPPWVDSAMIALRSLASERAKIAVAHDKKIALEKELREVSIRVNLFEKILIPRAKTNIKKISVFLGDQQLASVSQAKVAKAKIVERKREKLLAKQGERYA